MTGCTSLVVLSGPRTLAPLDTATYVLSLDGPGVDNTTLFVACDVPASWALVSNSYAGTIGGLPATGSAAVIPDPFPTALPPPGIGNQRIWLAEGPFDIAPDDSAELTLEFDVVDVPPGEFVLKFWFLASPDVMSSAHTYAAVTVNRESRLFSFVRALFEPDGALYEATSVAPSPDGRSVVLGGYGDLDPVLSVFDRDGLTGELSHNHGVNSGGGITSFEDIVFAPGSHHVYGCGSGFLAGFEHDPVSGQLSLVQVVLGGSGGHQPLGGARGIDLSPDGAHLYVAASDNEVVSIFSRDGSTGELTYVTYGWHEELHEPVALAVSPDGAHVYVVSPTYSTLVVFDRDQQTGELGFCQFVQDGVGGVEDMFFPQDVVVSSDGAHVYVTGYESDSVAWFERNPMTGELLFSGLPAKATATSWASSGPWAWPCLPTTGGSLWPASTRWRFSSGIPTPAPWQSCRPTSRAKAV